MARGVDPLVVDPIVVVKRRQYGIEEFQITVALITSGDLPALLLPFPIHQMPRPIESLWIDNQRRRPMGVNGELACGLIHRSALAMENENDRDCIRLRRLRRNHQRLADHPINCPLLTEWHARRMNNRSNHQTERGQE